MNKKSSKQPKWDEYEVAFLLNACLNVIKRKITQKEAIKLVSKALRERAIDNKLTIDSTYRNENGISLQLQRMMCLLQNKKSKLNNHSKLFVEIVNLYKNDLHAFNEILKGGKEMNLYNIESLTFTSNENPADSLQKSLEYSSGIIQYKQILANHYSKGFRLYDKLSLKRFYIQWEKTFGEELQDNDETVFNNIKSITIQHGDMTYLPESLLNEDTKQKLSEYIHKLFSSGKNIIYYEALYKEFSDEFAKGRINNIDMLKTYLSYINDGSMYLKKSYITSDNDIEIDTSDEVRKFLIIQAIPIRIKDIISSLSHIAENKIKLVLSGNNSNEFVRNKNGEYFHADVIKFNQMEQDLTIQWINSAIIDKGYMSGKELTDTIVTKLPSIIERYPFLTSLGLRDTIAYKLRNTFSFKGKIISSNNKKLSMYDIFADFAKNHEYFTLSQLNILKSDLDTSIYFEAIYANSLRINKEEFVSLSQAEFDVSATDSAIDNFCREDFISLQEVTLFGGFPNAKFSWNSFLLQHYVACYSKKYKLIHNGFNASYATGAIVRRSSIIESFDDVIIIALAQSNIALDNENALQYLHNEGYIARRKLSNIDAIITKANLYRAKKGDAT